MLQDSIVPNSTQRIQVSSFSQSWKIVFKVDATYVAAAQSKLCKNARLAKAARNHA